MNNWKPASILIIQPPFVQLNAPYPAPYYLKSFLISRGFDARVADHSIDLFARIFSRGGLTRFFADVRNPIEERLSQPLRGDSGEMTIRFNLSRFLSQHRLWIDSIDRTVAFLKGEDREFGHLLSAANGILPDGPRLDRLLESMDGNPRPDDAGVIASAMIADLADFITVALDPTFSLVRYAESLAASVHHFGEVESALDGYVFSTFYAPLLEEFWSRVDNDVVPTEKNPLILACTVPFPGCLVGALAAARSAKTHFGVRIRTIAGGGYVNTELRSIRAGRFFDYFDYLSFDRGYGSLEAILEMEGSGSRSDRLKNGIELYKTIYRQSETGLLIGGPEGVTNRVPRSAGAGSVAGLSSEDLAHYAETDAAAVVSTFPDYRGVDFSRYIRPIDDANPMHRLWSDGRWLKAYLAHGCYWHACAFCDVQLDYIRGYAPVDVDALFGHLLEQAEVTGVRGVHFVDEAAPVASLLRFAELNRAAGLPLVFWGNIRFEKAFSPDVAAALAAGGLLGVSAGIEVASEGGFKRLGKGVGLSDVVRACAAFKESGILTHAYLIYGFWDEDDGEIIDSVEIMRQLFSAGLVDSAFWHKFVLTRHSRVRAEWARGKHPHLKPLEADDGAADFANNDLRFAGEERTDRFTRPLDDLLSAWMSGARLDEDVRGAFPFRVPAPTVSQDLVDSLLDDYARDKDDSTAEFPGVFRSIASKEKGGAPRACFLGGALIAETRKDGRTRLRWRWRLDSWTLDFHGPQSKRAAGGVVAAITEASRAEGMAAADLLARLEESVGSDFLDETWRRLRIGGLIILPSRF